MNQEFTIQLIFFLRIMLACGCGAVIGYERKNRGKVAGLRTHIMVALGAALMMIISKYGFKDIIFSGDVKHDPSRIASQIVSGIGFLGAGMIFTHDKTVQGLTTAAGIWATAGIGMAIGAGMFALGVSGAILIVIVQTILHKNFKFLHNQFDEHIVIVIKDEKGNLEKLKSKIEADGIQILSFNYKKIAGHLIESEFTLLVSSEFDGTYFMKYDDDYIISISE